MSVFKVDKDIKMPPRWQDGGYTGIYPFNKMDVGDSFMVPAQSGNLRQQKRICAAAIWYCKRFNGKKFKFSVRAVSEGFRCWRIN